MIVGMSLILCLLQIHMNLTLLHHHLLLFHRWHYRHKISRKISL
ncbi:hypothetical protein KSF78_0009468 [Schistosoma japonicum]|nr:hypothetical protein KSF78_0009468 [Schistosoma japonicum]